MKSKKQKVAEPPGGPKKGKKQKSAEPVWDSDNPDDTGWVLELLCALTDFDKVAGEGRQLTKLKKVKEEAQAFVGLCRGVEGKAALGKSSRLWMSYGDTKDPVEKERIADRVALEFGMRELVRREQRDQKPEPADPEAWPGIWEQRKAEAMKTATAKAAKDFLTTPEISFDKMGPIYRGVDGREPEIDADNGNECAIHEQKLGKGRYTKQGVKETLRRRFSLFLERVLQVECPSRSTLATYQGLKCGRLLREMDRPGGRWADTKGLWDLLERIIPPRSVPIDRALRCLCSPNPSTTQEERDAASDVLKEARKARLWRKASESNKP